MLRLLPFLLFLLIGVSAWAGEDAHKNKCIKNLSALAHSKIEQSIKEMLREIEDPELYLVFEQYAEVSDSHAEALEEKTVSIGILLDMALQQPMFSSTIIDGLVAVIPKIEPELQETLLYQLESFYVGLYQQEKTSDVSSVIEDVDRNLSAILKAKLQLLERKILKEHQSISSPNDLRKIKLSQLLDRFHSSDFPILSSIEVMAVVMATEKNSAKSMGPLVKVISNDRTEYRAFQSFLRRAISAENFSADSELVDLASLYSSLLLSFAQIQNDVSRESQMNEDFRKQAGQWLEDYRQFYADLEHKERARLGGVHSRGGALRDSPLIVERYLVDALFQDDEKTLRSIIEARDEKVQPSLFRYVSEMARRNGKPELAGRLVVAVEDKTNTTSLFKALATKRGVPGKFSKEKTIEFFLQLPEDQRLDLIYYFSDRRFSPVNYIDFIVELANHSGPQNHWIRMQVFNYLLEAAKPISPGEELKKNYAGKGAKRWMLRRTPEVMTRALQNLRLFDENLFAGMEASLGEKITTLIDHLKQSNDENVELGVSVNPFEAVLSLLHFAELETSPRYLRQYLNDRLRLFSASWKLSLFEQNTQRLNALTSLLPFGGESVGSNRLSVLSRLKEESFRAQIDKFLRTPVNSSKLASEISRISQTLQQNLISRISILFKLQTGVQKMLQNKLLKEALRVGLYRMLEEVEFAIQSSLQYAAKRFESSERKEHGAGREVLRAGLLHSESTVLSANLLLALNSNERPLEMRTKALEQTRKFREDLKNRLQSGELEENSEFKKSIEILDRYDLLYFRLFEDMLKERIIASNKRVSGAIAARELDHILNLSMTKNPDAHDLLSLQEAKKVLETLQSLNSNQGSLKLIQYNKFKWPEKPDDIFEQELRAHFSAVKRYIEYLYAYADDGEVRWYAMEFRRLFDLN